MSSPASSRRTAARKPRRCWRDWRAFPRSRTIYVNKILSEFDIDAALEAPAAAHPRRRTRPHQRARQPAPQALPGCRGVAGRRDRCLHDRQHPAHREPERRGRSDHAACASARPFPIPILDRADAIELVDLTPDDLIQRLNEGKVYVPEQAERALKHFFSPANLTALRELALRRTAERVDEQLLQHMQARAHRGALGCRRPHPGLRQRGPEVAGLGALRQAAGGSPARALDRVARRDRAQPAASDAESATASPRRCGSPNALAESFTVPAADSGGLPTTSSASRRRTTSPTSSSATPARSRWFELLASARWCTISCAGPATSASTSSPATTTSRAQYSPGDAVAAPRRSTDFVPYIVALAGGGGGAWHLPAAPAAGRHRERRSRLSHGGRRRSPCAIGLWPSLSPACVAASLCYNFFFLPPVHTFTITDPTNVAAFVFFTLVAVIVSNLAARGARQAPSPPGAGAHAPSRSMASAASWPAWARWTTFCGPPHPDRLMLKVRVVAAAARGRRDRGQGGLSARGHVSMRPTSPPRNGPGSTTAPAGRDSDTLPGAKWLFLPMRTGRGADRRRRHRPRRARPACSTPDQRRLLDALVDQAALAIERVHLVEDIDRARRAGRNRPSALGPAHLDLA